MSQNRVTSSNSGFPFSSLKTKCKGYPRTQTQMDTEERTFLAEVPKNACGEVALSFARVRPAPCRRLTAFKRRWFSMPKSGASNEFHELPMQTLASRNRSAQSVA